MHAGAVIECNIQSDHMVDRLKAYRTAIIKRMHERYDHESMEGLNKAYDYGISQGRLQQNMAQSSCQGYVIDTFRERERTL